MNKYRVLKSYPKHITNSGRLVTLNKGSMKYLKPEPQVLRLVKLGFLKQIVELPRKKAPAKKRAKAIKKDSRRSEPEIKHKKNTGKE